MAFFDFFKKPLKEVENKRNVKSETIISNVKEQIGSNVSVSVKVTTLEPIPFSEEEIVPVEKRIKKAVPSKQGLYPHEVLMLDYASSFYTDQNSFQGFWWYQYGVRNVDQCLRSLLERGFLKIGDLQSAIEKETATVIKGELKKYGLKVSGKKDELVHRLMTEVSHEELATSFPKRTYQMTDLGKRELDAESYVPYIHRHSLENLDIWSLNSIVHEPPYMSYRDKIWGYLNKRSMEHFSARDYGLYRDCRYHMHIFLNEESRFADALGMLAEVVFYDLSGLNNSYDPQYLDIFAEHFFPYKESSVTTAPGIISSIMQCQDNLNLSDDEVKAILSERMKRLSAPLQLFTPEECADIVFWESCEAVDELTKVYAKAKKRFKQQYPEIKC